MEIQRRDVIDGLGKGLQIIEAFDEDHPRLTASEAAERVGITRTAARRYLLSLVHFGYALSDGKRFWLSPRVLRLGQSYLNAGRMPRLVQPFLQRLSAECQENFNFSVLDGHEVVYVVRSNNPRMISIGFQVGARLPAHVVTPGLAILSTMSDAWLEEWIKNHEFSAFTPNSVSTPAEFLRSVHAARALGFWVTEQQFTMGLRGIAMAVKDRKGNCLGAIGTTLPMQPLTREESIDRMVPRLSDVVQLLREIL
ncbi:IclR family transcriptional regulator domain-containing protein [Roseateles koreensis]|uniref:IclR family transcriptional regulator C-terminal domain-containing protein n=1 Tax=Roseateles koreensis TaxID=2987526 RepID=A0ABT5KQZ8_9BURK|nr:IclR family transcriptional regulator C-terminal domain-containing protein [Roseateles koreensis]MDC8785277.1 IclR family transcriptional regulator C-terminal domain-containing protein [Roseateles koreensis]